MIDDYRWRYAIVVQRRLTEECEKQLMCAMVEQGLTLRQMVAIFRVWLAHGYLSNVSKQDEIC